MLICVRVEVIHLNKSLNTQDQTFIFQTQQISVKNNSCRPEVWRELLGENLLFRPNKGENNEFYHNGPSFPYSRYFGPNFVIKTLQMCNAGSFNFTFKLFFPGTFRNLTNSVNILYLTKTN